MEKVDCIVMPFDGSTIDVIRDPEGQTWVSVRSVCKAIGLETEGQRKKLTGDQKFSCVDMYATGKDSKSYNMFCISLVDLTGWLYSINSKRVREDIKPRLLAYQQECALVLHKHFMPRGEVNLAAFIAEMRGMNVTVNAMNAKFDYLVGMDMTVFGDDATLIKDLLDQLAAARGVTTTEAWSYIRKECDVSSYKLQNRKIINFIKKELGQGLTLIKGGIR